MKAYIRVLGLLLFSLFFCSCASQPPIPAVWAPEKEAIHLRLHADPRLNLHDGVPHTVLVCVYQLRSPNVFNQLADDLDGIYKLLECGLFDGSVARAQRFFVQPGQDFKVDLDRAEGGRIVAIVAGYYLLQKERIVRLFEVPVVEEKTGTLRRRTILKPGPLHIELTLGPKQIYSAEGE